MKKLEIIFVALTLLAFALSLNNIVWGSTLSLFMGLALMVLCLVIGIKAMSGNEGTDTQRGMSLASYTAGSIFIVLASVFRILFWPMGHLVLYQATFVAAIVFVVILVAYSRNKSKYYQNLLLRNFLYLAWAGILIAIPSRALVSYKYGNSPFYAKYAQISDALNADPDNEELWKQQKLAWQKLRYTQQYVDIIGMAQERRMNKR